MDSWRTDWPHPFDHELIMDVYEPRGDSPMDLHRALTAIDRHMDWLRHDVRGALARDRPGYDELHRDATSVIYGIPDGTWEEVTNALRGSEYVERAFTGRIGIATQQVHARYAEREITGNVLAETVLVRSTDPTTE
jgi:hypothetical protein